MKKQYAALPFRIQKSETQILLITTRQKGKWSVPKGWPMKNRTPPIAAAIEAFEEAGIVGKVGRKKIGKFTHRKNLGAKTFKCDVDVYPLTVQGKLNKWPEKNERKRRWFSKEVAAELVKPKGLRRAIRDIL
jgi:8-oxo-dGTP pyrophosphatase MutT (NUDIX family)